MRETFVALKDAQREIASCAQARDQILVAYENRHPKPSGYSEVWYSAQDADAEVKQAWNRWKEAMRDYGLRMVATMHAQRAQAELIRVPDGAYQICVQFAGRGGQEVTQELMPVTLRSSTLADVISRAQADISMEGIHNFGFRVPPDAYKGALVSYEVRGPDGLTYRSSCLVDQGGQILQGAWQFT